MDPIELAFWIIFAAIFGYVIVAFIRFFFQDVSFPSPRRTTRHDAGGGFGESAGVDSTGVSTATSSTASDVSIESSDVSTDSSGGDVGSAGGDFSGGGGDSGGGGASGGWND